MPAGVLWRVCEDVETGPPVSQDEEERRGGQQPGHQELEPSLLLEQAPGYRGIKADYR